MHLFEPVDASPLPTPSLPAGGRRLIVAEDDAALRERIVAQLRSDGYTIVEALDAKELFDRVRDSLRPGSGIEPFAAIVSDTRTPTASGMTLLLGLRSVAGATPIILVAPPADALVFENAGRLGRVTVLDEPVDVDELRLAVLRIVGRA